MSNSEIDNPLIFPISSVGFIGEPFLTILNITGKNIKSTNKIHCDNILKNGLSHMYTLYNHLPDANKVASLTSIEILLSKIDITLNILGLYNNDISAEVISEYIDIQIDNLNKISSYTDNVIPLVTYYDKLSSLLQIYIDIKDNPGETIRDNIIRDIYNKKVPVKDIVTISNYIPNAKNLTDNYLEYLENNADLFEVLKNISRCVHHLIDADYNASHSIQLELDSYVKKFNSLVTKEKKKCKNEDALDSLLTLQKSVKNMQNSVSSYVLYLLGDTEYYTLQMSKIQNILYEITITLETMESALTEASLTMADVVENIYEINNFISSTLMYRDFENYKLNIDNIKYNNSVFNTTIMKSLASSMQSLEVMYKFMNLNKPKKIEEVNENSLESLIQSKEGKKYLYKKANRIYLNTLDEISYEKTYNVRLELQESIQKSILNLNYKLDIIKKTESASQILNSDAKNEFKVELDYLAATINAFYLLLNPVIKYAYNIFGFTHMYLDYDEYRESLSHVNFLVKKSESADYTKKIGAYERSLDMLRELLKVTENSLYMVDYSMQNNISLQYLKELA